MTAADRAAAEALAQGLSERVTDPGALAKVAALLRAGPEQRSGPSGEEGAAGKPLGGRVASRILHQGCVTARAGGA